MKKLIVVIVLVIVLGTALSAAAPASELNHNLRGLLHYQRNTICGTSYHVPVEAMFDVFLTGNFKPQGDVLAGCRINATGFFYTVGTCAYFNVDSYQAACSATQH
jgi:hypothetical protein